MSSFASPVDAVAFLKSLPPVTGPDSAWAGIDPARIAECVDLGLSTLDEFKVAAAKVAAATAAAKSVKADWRTITEASLPKACQELLAKKRATDKQASAMRQEFEKNVTAHFAGKVPAGKKLVFGYRFGKLSLAIVDDDGGKAAKGAIGLDDLFV